MLPFLDLDQATRHLTLLDDEVPHIFAVLPEAPDCTARARQYVGRLTDLASRLAWMQRKGCGVFITVNAMNGRRRRNVDVARIRALWAERDGPGSPLPLMPSMVIATSPGRCHDYLLTDPDDAEVLTPTEARLLNRRIAAHCSADAGATDPARLLRLAGTWNLKREPFLAHVVVDTGTRYDAATLRAAFPAPADDAAPPTAQKCISSRPHAAAVSPDIRNPARYMDAVIALMVAELATAPEGTRNITLNRLAFRLARLGLDHVAVAAELAPAAVAIGLGADEIEATIRSAVRGAMRS